MLVYSILISLLVVGLTLSWIASILTASSWQQTWLMQLASAIFISGGIGIIERALTGKDFLTRLSDTIFKSLNNEAYLAKLKEIVGVEKWTESMLITNACLKADDINYTKMIENDPVFSMVANDGKTWTSHRIEAFQSRFEKEGFLTEIFVTDPEGIAVSVVAKKTEYEVSEQQGKIALMKKRIVEEWNRAGNKGELIIYYIPFYVTHSVFLGSDTAYITLYGISSGRRRTPVFECRKREGHSGLYDDICNDIEELRKQSRIAFPENTKPN